MAKSTKDKFIRCQVSEGMFRSELAVEFELYSTPFSMFAPKESVVFEGELPTKGLLRVRVLNKKKGLIELPAETLQQGRRYLQMPVKDLVTA